MSKAKIMIVDDEPDMLELLQESFEDAGFTVVTANNGVQGLRRFFETQPELVITDILMPEMDGMTMCQRIREVSLVPIIMLTALHFEEEKVKALLWGADDYMTKPAPRKELIARVEANLRRYRWPTMDSASSYSDSSVHIDFARREVTMDSRRVDLTPLEYRLLVLLVQHPHETLSSQRLLAEVWGPEYDSPDPVKYHVGNLRKKLEQASSSPSLIVNVRGFGYRYERPDYPVRVNAR